MSTVAVLTKLSRLLDSCGQKDGTLSVGAMVLVCRGCWFKDKVSFSLKRKTFRFHFLRPKRTGQVLMGTGVLWYKMLLFETERLLL